MRHAGAENRTQVIMKDMDGTVTAAGTPKSAEMAYDGLTSEVSHAVAGAVLSSVATVVCDRSYSRLLNSTCTGAIFPRGTSQGGTAARRLQRH